MAGVSLELEKVGDEERAQAYGRWLPTMILPYNHV